MTDEKMVGGELIGKRIGGYKIKSVIMHGGMGVVYECEKNGLKFVMKVIHPDVRGDYELRERFSREIEAVYEMSGPAKKVSSIVI